MQRYIVLFGILSSIIQMACEGEDNRKIRLSDDAQPNAQTASSVLQVDEADRYSLTILAFRNQTGDPSIDWLQRGLAEMLATQLSQSSYFQVLGIEETSKEAPEDLNRTVVAARRTGVETLLVGSFDREGDKLNVKLRAIDVPSGNTVMTESMTAESLERIFPTVDLLSEKLQVNLHGELAANREERTKLAQLTESIDAFKCYSQALAFLERFSLSDADSCLSKAIRLDSTFASAYLRLAWLKFRSGKPEIGQRMLNAARRHADRLSEPDRLMVRVYEAEEEGDADGLLQSVQELLRFEPYDLTTRLQIANYLAKFHETDRAIREYETILERDPDQTSAMTQLGHLYAERGDFHTALHHLDKYIAELPDDPHGYTSKGEVLMRAGRFQDAIKQFQLALRHSRDFYPAAANLSRVYAEVGDLESALEYLDKWQQNEENPVGRSKALAWRGNTLWRFNRLADAERALSAALEVDRNNLEALLMLGELYERTGRVARAGELYRGYLVRFRDFRGALDHFQMSNLLRFCMEADLDTKEKIPVLKKIAEQEERPLHQQIYDMHLGLLYLRAGDYAMSNKYFNANNKGYMELVGNLPRSTWSWTWKYSVEAIRLQPLSEAYDFAFFDQIVAGTKASPHQQVAVIAHFLRAQYYGKYDRRQRLASEYLSQGTPLEDHWRVIGPFENIAGFERALPPEAELDLEGRYTSGGRSLTWIPLDDGAYDGYANLRGAFDHPTWGVAYATVNIKSPDQRQVQIRLATDEAAKLWLNGRLVWQFYRTHDVPLDNDIVSVLLQPGDNTVLLKVTNSFLDWGYYFRVTDEAGHGFPDITFGPVTEPASYALQSE